MNVKQTLVKHATVFESDIGRLLRKGKFSRGTSVGFHHARGAPSVLRQGVGPFNSFGLDGEMGDVNLSVYFANCPTNLSIEPQCAHKVVLWALQMI